MLQDQRPLAQGGMPCLLAPSFCTTPSPPSAGCLPWGLPTRPHLGAPSQVRYSAQEPEKRLMGSGGVSYSCRYLRVAGHGPAMTVQGHLG